MRERGDAIPRVSRRGLEPPKPRWGLGWTMGKEWKNKKGSRIPTQIDLGGVFGLGELLEKGGKGVSGTDKGWFHGGPFMSSSLDPLERFPRALGRGWIRTGVVPKPPAYHWGGSWQVPHPQQLVMGWLWGTGRWETGVHSGSRGGSGTGGGRAAAKSRGGPACPLDPQLHWPRQHPPAPNISQVSEEEEFSPYPSGGSLGGFFCRGRDVWIL